MERRERVTANAKAMAEAAYTDAEEQLAQLDALRAEVEAAPDVTAVTAQSAAVALAHQRLSANQAMLEQARLLLTADDRVTQQRSEQRWRRDVDAWVKKTAPALEGWYMRPLAPCLAAPRRVRRPPLPRTFPGSRRTRPSGAPCSSGAATIIGWPAPRSAPTQRRRRRAPTRGDGRPDTARSRSAQRDAARGRTPRLCPAAVGARAARRLVRPHLI